MFNVNLDLRKRKIDGKEGSNLFDKNKFRAQMVLVGITSKRLADELGINESTLYRKINADGNFTRDEISQLVSILKIDNPQDIFFANELA